MRSVPPTGQPFATLRPNQTRDLATAVVSLNPPVMRDRVLIPDKGERLELGDVTQLTDDPRLRTALRRLAAVKAPPSTAQLVMWRLAGLDWATIAKASRKWSNPSELALAKAFVADLGAGKVGPDAGESASMYWDVTGVGAEHDALADGVRKALKDKIVFKDAKGGVVDEEPVTVLGLTPRLGIPDRPSGPALSCRLHLEGTEATVQIASGAGGAWQPLSKFTLPLTKSEGGRLKAYEVADEAAGGVVGRLIRVQLAKEKGRDRKGKDQYRIKIDNLSPLILNGVALGGPKLDADRAPTGLAGFSLPPRKSLSVPMGIEAVERLGLTEGVRVLAADLSGL